MDVPDDEETFTLIKSDADESVNQFDRYIQDASKDNCDPVSSLHYESLQIFVHSCTIQVQSTLHIVINQAWMINPIIRCRLLN